MKAIGIIGFGNMGSCIAKRIKSRDIKIWVFDKDNSKTKNLSGIKVAENSKDLVNRVEAVILAVKPQDFDATLNEIKDNIDSKLVISIAAGITTAYIERRLGEIRVIRTMPNMPARVGKGMICLCEGAFSKKEDLSFTKRLFNNLGEVLVMREDMIDAATAISGSGPGYFYYLMQAKKLDINNKDSVDKFKENFTFLLAASAISTGFSSQYAMILANTTTEGSVKLIKELKLSPEELRRQIASKGGTTEAALEVLRRGGSLKDAVKAALNRAKDLARN